MQKLLILLVLTVFITESLGRNIGLFRKLINYLKANGIKKKKVFLD